MPPTNLPPGCASDDGGIDHEFEKAIEELINKIPDTITANLVLNFLDTIKFTYECGYMNGEMAQKMANLEDKQP